jgi:hypothetical protein
MPRLRRLLIPIALPALLAGCFTAPSNHASPQPGPPQDLLNKVETALAGHRGDAMTYAGLYAVLADRLEDKAYATTSDAAGVAGRVADILHVPGLLKQVVNEELNPLFGKPQPLTPELAAKAAAKLRELSAACREAAQ